MRTQTLGSGHVITTVIIRSKMLRLFDLSRYSSRLPFLKCCLVNLPEGPIYANSMLAMLGSTMNECAHYARLGVMVRRDLRIRWQTFPSDLVRLITCIIGRTCSIFSHHNILKDCGFLRDGIPILSSATLDCLQALVTRPVCGQSAIFT